MTPQPFDAQWSLERGAWSLLVHATIAGGDEDTAPVTPAETSLMLRHAGELGRFPTLIEDALAASSSCEQFSARLAYENQVFLSDASPAARVRAYDWLLVRGLAPADYDPLGTRSGRRKALESQAELERISRLEATEAGQ